MFKSNSIRQRVLDAVNAKIEALQEKHDAECKRLDEQLEKDKADLADKLVNSIVSKI